jgi:hypothetical protein
VLKEQRWFRFELGWLQALLIAAVFLAAAGLGYRASATWFALLAAGLGGLVLLQRPAWGLLLIVPAALVVPLPIDTGSEVKLNAVTVLVPALLAVWGLEIIVRAGKVRLAAGKVNPPLALFVIAGLLSLFIGLALWDPLVPRRDSFMLVQLAQWSIFAFSAGAFWLTANLAKDRRWLRWMTSTFLLIGGMLAFLVILSAGSGTLALQVSAAVNRGAALGRAPFWMLLVALSAGQLLFNRDLKPVARIFLVAVLGAALVYAFVLQRQVTSHWLGISVALATLVWLRFPQLRWVAVIAFVVLAVAGGLLSSVYDFAGGDAEWEESGASRLVLIERVVEVTMRNPVTGLGPAAYRPYANMKPLAYGQAFWVAPQINSHNNYVDIFAHQGLLGLGLFAWFCFEIARLGRRLHRRYPTGFAAGYVNGMMAAGLASLAIMMLADWILPFVYNIGFPGFQASVLVWLFLGGLVALDNMPIEGSTGETATADR